MPEWYDSVWLNAYYTATDVVARVAPSRLDDFIRSFDILRTNSGFATRHLPNVLSSEMLEHVRGVIQTVPKDKLELHEMQAFGRFVVHDIPEFSALQGSLVDQVSEWAGEPLEPSYNFLSLYTRMGVCNPHLDSPSAKWTIDLCIDQSDPWPIHVSQVVPWPDKSAPMGENWSTSIKEDSSLKFTPKILNPGDAILFSGSSQWHYRDALPRDGAKRHCDLLFMHFIPRGSAELVRPKNWASLFDIPELASVPGIERAL